MLTVIRIMEGSQNHSGTERGVATSPCITQHRQCRQDDGVPEEHFRFRQDERGVRNSLGPPAHHLASAYHRKVFQWHPDKLNETMAQELRDYATRRTARINEAYERLRSARV